MIKRLTTKEQEELVLKNLKLVQYFVHKLNVAPSDYDDIVSIGTIGLSKAAATFDESKNIKFATYAAMCINNEIFMYFRKQSKHSKVLSLESLIATDKNGNELTLGETIESPNSNFEERIQDRESLERIINIILNLLKPRERLIMLYRMAGMTQLVISKVLNISQCHISRLYKKLRNKVSEYFTTTQQFKEVFKMAIVGNSYKISFFSKDVRHFNQIFAIFLQNLSTTEGLPDFKVVCSKERVIIHVPAHPESFSFIAQIIQEMDDYSLTFVSNKVEETEVSETEVSEESLSVAKKQIISGNLSSSIEVDKSQLTDKNSSVDRGSQLSQIREYMLSKETFTVKELKQHFPDMLIATINNALMYVKKKGLIISIGRGKYATNKN